MPWSSRMAVTVLVAGKAAKGPAYNNQKRSCARPTQEARFVRRAPREEIHGTWAGVVPDAAAFGPDHVVGQDGG